jgi:hypothetical protein
MLRMRGVLGMLRLGVLRLGLLRLGLLRLGMLGVLRMLRLGLLMVTVRRELTCRLRCLLRCLLRPWRFLRETEGSAEWRRCLTLCSVN